MTGNASCSFDAQDVLGRYPLGTLEPFPDGGLLDAADARKFALRTGGLQGLLKCFEGSGDQVHIPSYSNRNRSVKCKSRVCRYSNRNI